MVAGEISPKRVQSEPNSETPNRDPCKVPSEVPIWGHRLLLGRPRSGERGSEGESGGGSDLTFTQLGDPVRPLGRAGTGGSPKALVGTTPPHGQGTKE